MVEDITYYYRDLCNQLALHSPLRYVINSGCGLVYSRALIMIIV